TGDVLGLGGFTRDLRQHIAGEDLIAILNHEVSAGRHQVTTAGLASFDHDGRLALFIWRLANHVARETGDFIDFFVQRKTFLKVFKLHSSADFSEDREGVRIPLNQNLAKRNRITFIHLYLGAVNNRVALLFTSTVIDDGDRSGTVHHDQIARLRLHGLKVYELYA